MTHAEMRRRRTEAILTATRELVLQQGTGANLMTAIAARSGISRQRLYQYYPNLESLLGVLMTEAGNQIYGHLRALYSQFVNVKPAAEGVRLSLEAGLEYLCRPEAEQRDNVLLLCLLDIHLSKNPAIATLDNADKLRRPSEEVLEQLIRAGQRDGLFRTDVAPEAMVRTASEALIGFAGRVHLAPNGALNAPELRTGLVQTLIRYFQGSLI